MSKYIYRNKNNEFLSYYVENNSLYEQESNSNKKNKIFKNIEADISISFTSETKPNIFYRKSNSQNSKKEINVLMFNDDYWIEQPLFSFEKELYQFKVVQFNETNKNNKTFAIIYAIKSNEPNEFQIYISHGNLETFETPRKLGVAYSQSENIFNIEEIQHNHYALIYKTLKNKKISINYQEINSAKFSKVIELLVSDNYITDENYLFNNGLYLLYTKRKNYSYQLYLKIINDFSSITNKEILIFESKSIEKIIFFFAKDLLYIGFKVGKNFLYKYSINSEIVDSKSFTNINIGNIPINNCETYKLIGYSFKNDNFILNNIYLNTNKEFVFFDKFCNIKPEELPTKPLNIKNLNTKNIDNYALSTNNNSSQNNPNLLNTQELLDNQKLLDSIEEITLRNKALQEENKQLKKSLRFYETI